MGNKFAVFTIVMSFTIRELYNLLEKMSEDVKKLDIDLNCGNLSKINETLDNLEYSVYKIEDRILSIKSKVYRTVEVIYNVISGEILRMDNIEDEDLEDIKKCMNL